MYLQTFEYVYVLRFLGGEPADDRHTGLTLGVSQARVEGCTSREPDIHQSTVFSPTYRLRSTFIVSYLQPRLGLNAAPRPHYPLTLRDRDVPRTLLPGARVVHAAGTGLDYID